MNKNTALLVLIALFSVFSAILNAQVNKSKRINYDLFLRTSDSWKMAVKEVTVTREFQSDDPQELPGRYFHGALLKNELEGREPGPVVFHVDFPSRGEFIFYLGTVSDSGVLKVTLDNKELKTFTFLTGPEGKGPWIASRFTGDRIFQCDYNKEYNVAIPAGKHDIKIQNMGKDWLSINHFVFTKYSRRILNPEYEEWKTYKKTLNGINKRLKMYENKARLVFSKEPEDINYDVIPTLKLQLENFKQLAKNHSSIDFNLIRTENELKEIFKYVGSGKDYIKSKRGRIKVGYLSGIDNTYQPYDVCIPSSYNPSEKYNLIISLHGYQTEIQKYSNFLGENKKLIPDSLHIITAALYGRKNHSYRGAAEEDVLTVMKEVQSSYSINPDKVYLMGSSMGGFGTWSIGLNYPHLFAAVSPVCAPSIFTGTKFIQSISPLEYISNAQYLPARIYHGAADSTVNVTNSRQMVEKLKEMKYPHVYTEYPNVGHDAWNNAEADSDRLPWLLQYTRNPYPNVVKHKAFYLRYGKAYWLQITGKKDWNEYSEIQGEIVGDSEIRIHTKNISSFYIDFRHPSFDPDKSLKIAIDNDSTMMYILPQGMDFHISKDSTWSINSLDENHFSKKIGSEGPFNAIETNRFLFIYGTGKPDRINLLKKIGIMLQKNYSNSDMDIKLIPDTLITKNNLAETNNLYLIGSPEENSYFREILPDLPISFSKDSMELNGTYNRQETGVQMIYPNPKQTDHYIIIDKYPEFIPDTDQLVNFPVADYFIYSFKDGKFEVLKDEYFGSDWQVIK
jgi:dienelactone hydrolase